jgi:uncharacterized protein YjbJ (UPF0337 family)
MNWDQVEGRWDQFKGAMKSKWSKLTDDDLGNLKGKRQQIIGRLVELYGIKKDEAERQINDWLKTI